MAKPKKLPPPKTASDTTAPAIPTPQFKWNVVWLIAGMVLVLWVLAFLLVPYVSYWGVGVMAVLTLALAGFGVYLYRLMQDQGRLAALLQQGVQSEEGRKAAIAELASSKGGDEAMNAMARAQLVARDDKPEAIRILEGIDLLKAQEIYRDDIRANLAFLYLDADRLKDARTVADKIAPEKGPTSKQKALYTAVVAESFARTGSAAQAKPLLDAIDFTDAEIGELLPVIFRAQVFTYVGTKNRGLAKKAMQNLTTIDPNHLGPFLMSKARTPEQLELQKMAREVLTEANYQTRPKTKMVRG